MFINNLISAPAPGPKEFRLHQLRLRNTVFFGTGRNPIVGADGGRGQSQQTIRYFY